MRSTIVTISVVGGLLFAIAAPAAAAPTVIRTATVQDRLYSASQECTPEVDGRQTCTSIALVVDVNGLAKQPVGSVYLWVYTYMLIEGSFLEVSAESQTVSVDASVLNITNSLDATLEPVSVTLQSCDFSGVECFDTREVVVSANDSPTGAVQDSRTTNKYDYQGCAFRTVTNRKYADVAGTLTLDGVTYAEQGSASTSSTVLTSRCP